MAYFIEGPFREISLISEWIIVFFALEISLIFWLRIRNKKKKELKSLQEKAYLWLFFWYSIAYIFYIIGDYYVDVSFRLSFYYIAYFFHIIGALSFIRIIEKFKIFIKKYFFTTLFSILFMIFLILFFFNSPFVRNYIYVFYPVFGVFLLLYLKALYHDCYKKVELKNFKSDLLKLGIGFGLLVLGYIMAVDIVVNIFGFGIRILGTFFQLIGFLFLFLFFISSPSFSEYDWQEKIKSVLIMYKSGLFIYKKDFQESIDSVDDLITTGTLTILKMMLETFTEKEDISVIEKKGKVIIIQPGIDIVGAIICDEKLNSIQILLNNFIERIETIYSHILTNWDGDLNVFKLIEGIAKEIFY